MSEKEPHEGEIKVTDKRRFTSEGEGREPNGGEGRPSGEAAPKPTAKPASEPATGSSEPSTAESGAKSKAEAAWGADVSPIDFATFVLSLATSAQVHLGAIPNPATGKAERNSGLARQTIDILGMLQEKTKGNLSSEEARLLEHLLYDLRMMYVQSGEKES